MKTQLMILLSAAALASTIPAHAAVVICTGMCPSATENVLLNSATNVPLVTGSVSGTTVNFSSLDNNLTSPSNGQARVEAADGMLENLTFSLVNATFGLAEFFVKPHTGNGPAPSTSVNISWFNAMTGLLGNQTVSISTNGNAGNENRITVYGDMGERFEGLSLDFGPANTSVADVRQMRFAGIEPNDVGGVPEPATWGMMILGFGFAGAAMRRTKVRTRIAYS